MIYRMSLVAAWVIGLAFGLFVLTEVTGFIYVLYVAATVHTPVR